MGVWLTRVPKWDDFYSTCAVILALASYVYYSYTVLYALTEWSPATNKETEGANISQVSHVMAHEKVQRRPCDPVKFKALRRPRWMGSLLRVPAGGSELRLGLQNQRHYSTDVFDRIFRAPRKSPRASEEGGTGRARGGAASCSCSSSDCSYSTVWGNNFARGFARRRVDKRDERGTVIPSKMSICSSRNTRTAFALVYSTARKVSV